MSGWLSLAILVAASSVLLASVCALVVALGVRWGDAWLDRMAMRGRVRLVLLMAVAPMAVSSMILGLCFTPSLIAAVGWMSDHCLQHFHDHLHLCFRHLPTMGPGVTACVATIAGLLAFGAATRRSCPWPAAGLSVGRSVRSLVAPRIPPSPSIGSIRPRASPSPSDCGVHVSSCRAAWPSCWTRPSSPPRSPTSAATLGSATG